MTDEQVDAAVEFSVPGVSDGFVDENNEKIVYEYDENGNYTGWHKEPVE